MSSFKDVVGHKNIIKYISSAVQADAVSHAYILNGERGSGKRLLANLFAMRHVVNVSPVNRHRMVISRILLR